MAKVAPLYARVKPGDVIHGFTITSEVRKEKSPNGRDFYLVNAICPACGQESVKHLYMLAKGRMKGCRHCLAETIRQIRQSGTKTHWRRLRKIWSLMIRRTVNENDGHYEQYGGRGISVCKEWSESFEAFYAWALANGYDPVLQIDRINNDGNYTPANCRFVTRIENMNNRQRSWIFEAWGERKTAAQWARDQRCKVPANVLNGRLRMGWKPERAISTETLKEWRVFRGGIVRPKRGRSDREPDK